MKIASSLFNNNGIIPQEFTCLGANINPPLDFSGIPSASRSLVLILEDKDAAPHHWVHWLVFNIPPTTRHVRKNEIPQGGIQGLANNRTFGYEGPCPKYFTGTHRYQFTLLALDTILTIPPYSDKSIVLYAATGHILQRGTLIGICIAD